MTELRITLAPPHKCLSPNSRSHWAVKHRATQAARKHAWTLARAAIGRAPDPKWARATIDAVVYVKVNRTRDDDNFWGCMKPYRDGIASAGVMVNDSGMEIGRLTWVVDKARPRVEVTVRQIKEV